jgi:pSer/pThr/pTyr-binding forkhead associated (FHA) protein
MLATTAPLYVRLSWADPGTGRELEQLAPLPVTLGRTEENTISLNSQAVSRQHAQIERTATGEVVLTDQSSSNGTFLDGQRVSRAALQEGANIKIGPFVFAVGFWPPAPAQAATLVYPLPRPGAAPPQLFIRVTDTLTGQVHDTVAAAPLTIGSQLENSVILASAAVAPRHALVAFDQQQLTLTDQHSPSGTLLNAQRIQRAPVRPVDTIQIAHYQLMILPLPAPILNVPVSGPVPSSSNQNEATLIFQNDAGALIPFTPPSPTKETFPPAIFQQPFVSVQQLQSLRLPLAETTYLAIGGGMGSFAWVDHLRVAGVPLEQILCISPEPKPNSRYTRLCQNSQIPLHERIRSHSESCPDNLWGYPSYGVREIFRSLGKGQFGNALQVAGLLLGEPVATDTYTPRSGDVFASLDREAKRIGWERMWRSGRARAIRKTNDGRYVVAYSQSNVPPEQRHQLIITRYLHICVGYPGIQLLPDLQEYRERMQDFKSVVNAYEFHEHVYEHLLERGGTVMVRGRGIVASRVIQRLYEVRKHNPNVRILHLMRSPLTEGFRHGRVQRKIENNWEYEPFNWPKSCWGGTYLLKLEKADDQTRDRWINDWGGTTTAKRKDWRNIIKTGLREGWYQQGFGNVKRLERTPNGQLATLLQSAQPGQQENWLVADFVIDCTGLEHGLEHHVLLQDVVTHYRLGLNPKGRLKVTTDFEVLGMSNGDGHVFAGGIMTLGGPHAAQDSFLGLQYSALRSVDALARLHAPGVHFINGFYSLRQWTRWARGVQP